MPAVTPLHSGGDPAPSAGQVRIGVVEGGTRRAWTPTGQPGAAPLELLVIENVGNLVCPAEFDVGAHAGGHGVLDHWGGEKPLRYPVMFQSVELVPINKMDLLPRLDFDLEAFRTDLRAVNPGRAPFDMS